ncbi:MAG: phosphatase PAP2 family protein [Acidobacteria bacterium]|nr:phosphatase PAP2 family protein [Acidobacteriota bacterium]
MARLPGSSMLLERLLLSGCLVLLGLAAFLAWSHDSDLLLVIYQGTDAGAVLFWRLISIFGSNRYLAPAVVGLSLLLWVGKQRATAVWLVLGWGMTSSTVALLKWLVARNRPPVPSLVQASGNAFPSGHAAESLYVFFFLLLLLAGPMLRPASRSLAGILRILLLLLFAILPLAVGYSRVYLGVHWPSDVLGGWAIGLFFLGLSYLFTAQVTAQDTVSLAAPEREAQASIGGPTGPGVVCKRTPALLHARNPHIIVRKTHDWFFAG